MRRLVQPAHPAVDINSTRRHTISRMAIGAVDILREIMGKINIIRCGQVGIIPVADAACIPVHACIHACDPFLMAFDAELSRRRGLCAGGLVEVEGMAARIEG